MIAEYLNREYVLAEMRTQRDKNASLLQKVNEGSPKALQLLARHHITPEQLKYVVDALSASLSEAESAENKENEEGGAPFIPRDVVTCAFQSGGTNLAISQGQVIASERAGKPIAGQEPESTLEGVPTTKGAPAVPLENAAPRLRLAPIALASGEAARLEDPFVESEDLRYGVDGFWAKLGGLFIKRHSFNPNPARVAQSTKSLRIFIFGDWGTGLPLAQQVTTQIKQQLFAAGPDRQQHVIHLGDVYYTGEPKEYQDRMLSPLLWPVRPERLEEIGSWSLNGNHDMYSGGRGYFETLLREERFIRWHGDKNGNPSSFFLIEDPDWQIFGLDSSWNVPTFGSAFFGAPTLKDYGGQNGILTPEQVAWMAGARKKEKGCILLTHHQPASSRTTEGQHSEQAIAAMKVAGVYSQLDGWIWGHEHRGVVFKPKAQRSDPALKDAPEFCACIGHGGVPVPAKNFEAESKKSDVLWEEDRLDSSAPVYGTQRVVPFGFARLETEPGKITFVMFDHHGSERYKQIILRT